MSAAGSQATCGADAVAPAGWHLGRESWSFHRQFFDRTGRPAEHLEYSNLLWQIRRGAEKIKGETSTGAGVYRVKAADGQMILVRGGRVVLLGVMQADWSPPPKPKPKLSLGKPLAKDALNARLRRFGAIPTK